MDSVNQLQMLRECVKLWLILDRIEKQTEIPEVCCQRLCTFCQRQSNKITYLQSYADSVWIYIVHNQIHHSKKTLRHLMCE